MNYELLSRLIEEFSYKINFGTFDQGTSDEWIEKAQFRLGVQFPPSYIWWLKNYKGGEINGDEIFSIYELDFDSVVGGDIVYMNELNRRDGLYLSKQLVIQNNNFGEDYYLDLTQVDDKGESPVYVSPSGQKYAENFLVFLENKIKE